MIVNDWQARHGLDAAAHQAAFEDLSGRGYRLVKITSYDAGGMPRYASIWHRQNGNPWRALHGVSEDRYQEAIDSWGAEGYQPLTFKYERDGVTNNITSVALTCPDRRGRPITHPAANAQPDSEEWTKWDLVRTLCTWRRQRWLQPK